MTDMQESENSETSTKPQGVRVTMDTSQVVPTYANMCRVSTTPEEVILDLALNPNPLNAKELNLKVSQRIILNHYTAKRLAGLLTSAIQQHEATFGVLETDVRKRVQTPEKSQ